MQQEGQALFPKLLIAMLDHRLSASLPLSCAGICDKIWVRFDGFRCFLEYFFRVFLWVLCGAGLAWATTDVAELSINMRCALVLESRLFLRKGHLQDLVSF